MKKIVVIYFSNSGNTEMMAEAIVKGATSTETEVKLLKFSQASPEDIKDAQAIAMGCPACGSEEVDDTEVLPFIDTVKDELSGKELVLFGSFGWGDGEYMEEWSSDMESYGAKLLAEGLTLLETPDDDGLVACEALGAKLK